MEKFNFNGNSRINKNGNSIIAFFLIFLMVIEKQKYLPLAPIEVKILICWLSAYKIATESGTTLDEISNISAPKN